MTISASTQLYFLECYRCGLSKTLKISKMYYVLCFGSVIQCFSIFSIVCLHVPNCAANFRHPWPYRDTTMNKPRQRTHGCLFFNDIKSLHVGRFKKLSPNLTSTKEADMFFLKVADAILTGLHAFTTTKLAFIQGFMCLSTCLFKFSLKYIKV